MTSLSLPARRLGTTEMEITAVGFGAWALGGAGWRYGWGAQDDDESVAAIHHAVSRGINWIDTAAVYGLGHSEEVVGRAVRELPEGERPYVFTKCGMVWDEQNPQAEPPRILRPDSIRRECDASLRRLGVERIDLYQFHWPDPSTPVEDSWGTMLELIQAGKVRAGGVCNFSVDLLERCERIGHVDSLQPPFSLIRREAAEDLLPWCQDHRTGVIVYSPMQSGLLTDGFSAARVASMQDDWRSGNPEFQEPRLSRNLALRDALKPIAERHGVTVAAVAVAWTLSWPGVTGAIVGARTPAQVDGWLPAAALVLTDADLDEIAAAVERTGAGSGPARPRVRV
ncbi:MAG TPA: aldo/keto reductase [Candidatus Dormibacteraeota bacterium]|jgi:aryl-alcohol dehydrogenase-like predicted oxidoreductase|nr:aldo/keto reductase [Candidatus Dormibacteraeota bacterium]